MLIAWGTTEGRGRNTIGRGSTPLGSVTVRLDGERVIRDRNWVQVGGLKPDTVYSYEVRLAGALIGQGTVRTLPVTARRLDFFVIGDYGDGSSGQRAVAAAMWREYQRLKAAGRPVRFVLTVGDNIYSDKLFGIPLPKGTGDDDSHWETKHFAPYKPILREIPFYMTLGNHDGEESESAGDLPVQLDNFFFPGNAPSRYYSFGVAGLVDFFILDTTKNVDQTMDKVADWLAVQLAGSRAPWKIAVGHHPPFTAGPNHAPSREQMQRVLDLFNRYQVAAYFCGHEHNFQVSASDSGMGVTRMFLTGAGGELRSGNVRSSMSNAGISAWAPSRHFLHVEIDGDVMRVTPVGPGAIRPVGPNGQPVQLPFVVTQP